MGVSRVVVYPVYAFVSISSPIILNNASQLVAQSRSRDSDDAFLWEFRRPLPLVLVVWCECVVSLITLH